MLFQSFVVSFVVLTIRILCHIRLRWGLMRTIVILTFACTLWGGTPPADLIRRVAQRETESEAIRGNYTYRQSVSIEEMGERGNLVGSYRELRDITFTPAGERSDVMIGKPTQTLVRLKLTEEDFRDIREIQPLLLTRERLFMYQAKFKGEQEVDGVMYYVLQVTPRQILDGQRLFEGFLYVDQTDFSIVRMEGRAVPQIFGTKQENLFPHFTTIREKKDQGVWFPVYTHSDDTLPFRNGPMRLRMKIEYSNYKRFGAETTIRFEDKPKP